MRGIYFKEPAHRISRDGKSETQRASWQAANSGGVFTLRSRDQIPYFRNLNLCTTDLQLIT